MQIKQLKLINFRKYSFLHLDNLNSNLVIIRGSNGSGKTSILEAISFMSLAKSFKKVETSTCLKDKESGFNIKLEFDNYEKDTSSSSNRVKKIHEILDSQVGSKSTTTSATNDQDHSDLDHEDDFNDYHILELQYDLNSNSKKVLIDSLEEKKVSSLLGKLLSVFSLPLDTFLFSKSPEERRNLVNSVLSSVSNEYLYALKRYNLILNERNKALCRIQIDDDLIECYAKELVNSGYRLLTDRRNLVIFINKRISDYFNKLYMSDNDKNSSSNSNSNSSPHKLKLTYVNTFKTIMDYDTYRSKLLATFEENKSIERMKQTTLFGPHRDNFTLSIDGKPIEEVGSQAQNKLAVLALKLCVSDYFYVQSKRRPVLLLDDIFSDLDESRSEKLLDIIMSLKYQTFITTNRSEKDDLFKGINYSLINLDDIDTVKNIKSKSVTADTSMFEGKK